MIIYYSDSDEVGGIISEDSDILVFGGTKLIKNLNIKNGTYDEYDLDNILNYMLEVANIIRDKNNLSNEDNYFLNYVYEEKNSLNFYYGIGNFLNY